MAAGLQCWDASGNLTVDLTDRLTQMLGTAVAAAGGSGSFTVPETGSGNAIWLVFVPTGATTDNQYTIPQVTISGNTVTWSSLVVPTVVALGGIFIYGRY